MAWSQRYRIASRAQLRAVLAGLAPLLVDEREPLELILRTEHVPIKHVQRKRFHAICKDIAPLAGMTPGNVKRHVKADYYGVSLVYEDGVYVEVIESSEDSDGPEYERLADHALQWAAERGHFIPDRKPRNI